jgi:hypothetical protein
MRLNSNPSTTIKKRKEMLVPAGGQGGVTKLALGLGGVTAS